MRAHVDENRCQGHVLCNITTPSVFGTRDDDGHAVILVDEIPEALAASVRRSVASCPEQAISLAD
jgi:ferredoxin